MTDFADLKITGRVATPADPDWDEIRPGWNLAADQNPAAIAYIESADDVSKVLKFANRNDLRVAGQGTGHGAVALGPLDETILVKTDRMRGIDIEAEAETARIEAGVLSAELGMSAQKYGMCSMPGSSPDVGVIGYTLGGGLSWLGRKYGFACNRVKAIELVTADGQLRQVTRESNPDLFWALRGGGGGYAIVTALHLSLVPISEVYAGTMIFPAEVGADAIRTYRDWTETAPDEVTSSIRFLTPPDIPDVPEPIRNKPLFTVGFAFLGSREEGEKVTAPLRKMGEPMMSTVDQIPAMGLSRIHMDPEQPVPGLGHHGLIKELKDEAIDAFVGVAGPESGSPLLQAEIRHAGGALGRSDTSHGALDRLDAGFVMMCVGLPMTPELGEAIERHADTLVDTMEPWSAPGGYLNFAERPCDLDEILPADTCKRLAQVKRSWDPDNRIQANHSIALAPA